ncbi:ArsR/SmtB family transcription factor [Lentzea sp. CA-135723]|uniref:ArsR/SmtB family transcription factor n=1 Tax=Lentzea sp. CA-135723 TaxID=3239950 RepID=UPI003D8EBD6D
MVLRIHFTADDLARTRMTAGLGPVAESIFALDLLAGQRSHLVHELRKHFQQKLGDRLVEMQQFGQEYQPIPDLLWMLNRRTAADVAAGGRGAQQIASTVFEFCRNAVLPSWGQLRDRLELEREVQARIAISSGVEGLLGSLHPRFYWNAPVLEIADAADRDIHLNGRGLLLSPAIFLQARRHALIENEKESGMTAIAFSVGAAEVGVDGLNDTWDAGEQALSALVGTTRAAALRVLTESCTTSVLSERLGISLAGASKHATVLRKAGLITTARNRNTALHTLTSLGQALLRKREGLPLMRSERFAS